MNKYIKDLYKKQIPQKLIIDKNLGGKIYDCPNCKKILGALMNKKPNYCQYCGQAIYWEDNPVNEERRTIAELYKYMLGDEF